MATRFTSDSVLIDEIPANVTLWIKQGWGGFIPFRFTDPDNNDAPIDISTWQIAGITQIETFTAEVANSGQMNRVQPMPAVITQPTKHLSLIHI